MLHFIRFIALSCLGTPRVACRRSAETSDYRLAKTELRAPGKEERYTICTVGCEYYLVDTIQECAA